MAFRVAGYVKLAKLWEKNRVNAILLHNQYFAERFRGEDNYDFVGAYIDTGDTFTVAVGAVGAAV